MELKLKRLVEMRRFVCLLMISLSFGFIHPLTAQEGAYRIEVGVKNYEGDTLKLGYYFGKSQYLKDTAVVDQGKFVFSGEGMLDPGVYLIVFPPDNNFVHILITGEEQDFSVEIDMDDIIASTTFKGSKENDIYYNYLRELEKKRPLADKIKEKMAADTAHEAKYREDLAVIDMEVRDIQLNIIEKYPASLTTLLIKGNTDVEIPDFEDLDDTDRRQKQYEYYRAHYFVNFDLNDPRSIRSGMMQQKIDFYLQKLTYQLPDSQIVAMDYLLDKMDQNPEGFQYYLVEFLNESARSKRMGMDAVYVHLVDTYYKAGKATWMEEEQKEKLIKQAETLRPILIGKTAPDLQLFKQSGESIKISEIDAEYTVLLFWAPDCGHCKKAIPSIIDFYNTYKDRGVELVAICTKTGSDLSPCWDTIKERGMDIWINVADQYLKSRYKIIYDIKTTPQIYILDKDKKIIVKKIAGEDLSAVMEEVMNLGKEK